MEGSRTAAGFESGGRGWGGGPQDRPSAGSHFSVFPLVVGGFSFTFPDSEASYHSRETQAGAQDERLGG